VRTPTLQPPGSHQRALAALQQAISAASPEELTALVGELERLKAHALHRLVDGYGREMRPPPHDPLDLLSIADVAGLLKLDPSTVYDHIRRGRLAVTPIGRAFRIRRADLERFLEARNSRQPLARS
jgi:excisionase family DNA binding protein